MNTTSLCNGEVGADATTQSNCPEPTPSVASQNTEGSECDPTPGDDGHPEKSLPLAGLQHGSVPDLMTELPRQHGRGIWRYLRWSFFSVYRTLFTVALVPNLVALIIFIVWLFRSNTDDAGSRATNAATANFFVSLVARNEHFINTLFHIALSFKRAPLSIRRQVAKIYNYGGLHSGCATGGTLWFVLASVINVNDYHRRRLDEVGVLIISWLIIALLAAMLVFSYPGLRMTHRLHNHFEMVHRFAGWTVVTLFWIQLFIVAAADQSSNVEEALVSSSSFWLLICITLLIIYAWVHLRRRTVRTEILSYHAVRLHFEGSKPPGGTSIKLTDSPLKETHAFAVIPEQGVKEGFSVVVSKAGDWTGRLIGRAPSSIWTRGRPAFGVLRVALLFKPVIIVATGSGIGPCLGLFNEFPDLNCRVLWSTKQPQATYGREIMETVLRTDPNAIILQPIRDKNGQLQVDMLQLVYSLYRESQAEAVVIIANEKVTKMLVYGLESREVPAFGPIWDC